MTRAATCGELGVYSVSQEVHRREHLNAKWPYPVLARSLDEAGRMAKCMVETTAPVKYGGRRDRRGPWVTLALRGDGCVYRLHARAGDALRDDAPMTPDTVTVVDELRRMGVTLDMPRYKVQRTRAGRQQKASGTWAWALQPDPYPSN